MSKTEISDVKALEWANKLIQGQHVVSHDNPLTAAHFTKLTTNNSLCSILSYLVRHVKPNAEAQHIRLNLKRAQIKKNLIEDCKELTDADRRHNLKASVMDVRTNINMEVKELQILNEQKEELLRTEKELLKKISLFSLGHQNCLEESKRLMSYSAKLKDQLKNNKQNTNPDIDNQMKNNFHSTLSNMENLRESILNDVQPQIIQEKKLNLWNHVNRQLQLYPPQSLLSILTNATRRANNSITEQIYKVDLIRDARQLRLKCETDGTFVDEANVGGVLESVRGMLIEMSGIHVKCFLEGRKLAASTVSLQHALDAFLKNIQSAAENGYKDQEMYEAIVALSNEMVLLAGEKAALSKCQEIGDILHKRVVAATRAKEALLKKQKDIYLFNTEVKNGMKQMRCLVQSIDKSWDELCTKLYRIKSQIDTKTSDIVIPTPIAKDSVSKEFLQLQNIPMDLLCAVHLPDKTVSRHHLSIISNQVSPNLRSITQNLNQASVKNERNAEVIFEKKLYLYDLSSDLTRARILQQRIVHSNNFAQNLSSYRIKELVNQITDSDKRLEDKVKPLLTKCEKLLGQGLAAVSQMDTVIDNWWKQPAQFIEQMPITK